MSLTCFVVEAVLSGHAHIVVLRVEGRDEVAQVQDGVGELQGAARRRGDLGPQVARVLHRSSAWSTVITGQVIRSD